MLHGYRVVSTVTGLNAAPFAAASAPRGGALPSSGHDIVLAESDSLPEPSSDGPVILSYDYPGGETVHATAEADGSYLVEFSGTIRFRISPLCDRIEMAVLPAGDRGLALILLQGWVMAMLLALRGDVVLHATAVEVDGQAIAFLADSGMGKSTTAAMLVRDGATLLSEDILRVDRDATGTWVAHRGPTSLRLRDKAAELAQDLERIAGAQVHKSADGRQVVSLQPGGTEPVPLSAILIPHPSEGAQKLDIHWLPAKIAVVELNDYPRVYDWKDPRPIRRQFELTSAIASELPVGIIELPWGPPWPTGQLDSLRSEVADRVNHCASEATKSG